MVTAWYGSGSALQVSHLAGVLVYVDELLLTVKMDTAGWLSDRAENPHLSLARGIQASMLSCVEAQRSRSGRRLSGRLKRELIREINSHSLDLVRRSLHALRALESADASFLLEDDRFPDEADEPRFAFSGLPYLVAARELLEWSCDLRQRPASEQESIARYVWAHAEASVLRSRLGDPEVSFGERNQLRTQLAAADLLALKARKEWRTGPLLRGSSLVPYISPIVVPVELPPGAEREHLAEVARWYEELGSRHVFPGRLEGRCRALTSSAEAYEATGWGFSLLGVWLKALALSESSRRCDLCYRHLGLGMRKFCRCHARTSLKRQSARELHIAGLYSRDLPLTMQRAIPVHQRLLDAQDSPLDSVAMRSHAIAYGVPDALVEPASTLAAVLRCLYPIAHVRAKDSLAAHFRAMLDLCCARFRLPAQDAASALQILMERRRAVTALNWSGFCRTWFGGGELSLASGLTMRGVAWDVDHPTVTLGGQRPGEVAHDLARLSSWLWAEEYVDRHAFIDPQQVVELRRIVDPKSVRPLSFAQIGKRIGASAEAVRKAILYASSDARVPARRDRLLPQRRQLLEKSATDARRSGRISN